MGLFVDTTGSNVDLDELGITLTDPVVDFDLGSKFTARELREAISLTTAIIGGSLDWKKTVAGTIEPNADYDPDIAMADEVNLGIGLKDDRVVTFKDLTAENLTGASPGFFFTDSGTIQNAFLLMGNVPSNKTGYPILLNNPKIVIVATSNELVNTYSVEIFENDKGGTGLTLKHIIAVVAGFGAIDESLSITLIKGKELAVKINNVGASKNPNCTVIVKGDPT